MAASKRSFQMGLSNDVSLLIDNQQELFGSTMHPLHIVVRKAKENKDYPLSVNVITARIIQGISRPGAESFVVLSKETTSDSQPHPFAIHYFNLENPEKPREKVFYSPHCHLFDCLEKPNTPLPVLPHLEEQCIVAFRPDSHINNIINVHVFDLASESKDEPTSEFTWQSHQIEKLLDSSSPTLLSDRFVFEPSRGSDCFIQIPFKIDQRKNLQFSSPVYQKLKDKGGFDKSVVGDKSCVIALDPEHPLQIVSKMILIIPYSSLQIQILDINTQQVTTFKMNRSITGNNPIRYIFANPIDQNSFLLTTALPANNRCIQIAINLKSKSYTDLYGEVFFTTDGLGNLFSVHDNKIVPHRLASTVEESKNLSSALKSSLPIIPTPLIDIVQCYLQGETQADILFSPDRFSFSFFMRDPTKKIRQLSEGLNASLLKLKNNKEKLTQGKEKFNPEKKEDDASLTKINNAIVEINQKIKQCQHDKEALDYFLTLPVQKPWKERINLMLENYLSKEGKELTPKILEIIGIEEKKQHVESKHSRR